MKTIEESWLDDHIGRWGDAGLRAIAEKGVSPFAWDVPGDRKVIQTLALKRLTERWPLCVVCNGSLATHVYGADCLEPSSNERQ